MPRLLRGDRFLLVESSDGCSLLCVWRSQTVGRLERTREARELVNLYKNKKLREKLCVRERNTHEGWVSGRFRGLRAAIKFREERKRRFRSVAIVY